ncbi:MAG: SH3 domain-containing protein [Dehalococcoidia bacterium]|nr:SH3 domain-containing protein [Dehalococcoidia bacterium]
MTSRTLVAFASVILFTGALSLVLVRPVSAESTDAGERIVQVAQQSLHLQEGQCFPWVRRVVQEATGRAMGFGYREGYLSGGAIEVSLADVRAGDIVQIADDKDLGPGASYPGLHTSIVMHRQGNGLLTVIDSNSQWDGVVRIREDYDPQAAATRYTNLNVRAYRFSYASGGAPAPQAFEAGQGTQAASLTPGTTARVAGDGQCVNLRTGPGTGNPRVHCVADGSFVEVLDAAPVNAGGYRWVYVQSGWGAGWMADDFLVPASSTPPPTPAPTPTPAPGARPIAGTPSGALNGSLPTRGGLGLVTWTGGPVESLVASASSGGCSVLSAWVTVNGSLLGYTAGAPAFVNAQWRDRYPGDLPSTLLILICGGSGANAPEASAPSPGGGPSGAPQDGVPPGPAGNED